MFKLNNHEVLSPDSNFHDLSIRDLIEARDLFHVHLMNKRNVIATAIGRYRIRKDPEIGPDEVRPDGGFVPNRPARTLHNSEIRDYSWPCILVFVKKWMMDSEFRAYENMNELIPRSIYMPDGRIVPICVVEAPKEDRVEVLPDQSRIVFPTNLVGGGFPLIVYSQGVQRLATIGCIVTNGNKYYALTNKHVVGDPGSVIYTRLKGVLTPIGKSSALQLGNIPFGQVYPGWSGGNLFINSDIGLIEIDDVRMWRTDVFRLNEEGEYGKLADLNIHNFTLKLIGSRVIGFGSVSGKLEGEIAALFYRFKSVGGYEYASDFLIGPRRDDPNPGIETKLGDSGALWLLETQNKNDLHKTFMPIAVQWGQHTFAGDTRTVKGAYALATCLSNVLRALEVDLVRDWNLDNDYTWGKLGHFSIAYLACGLLRSRKLKALFRNNLELITFGYDELNIKDIDSGLARMKTDHGFVPLADVPDLVWKGKIAGIKRGKEGPNHFADMDKVDSAGKTLLERCQGKYTDMAYLTPEEWMAYYQDEAVQDRSKGLLPFRIWQIYQEMVAFARAGDVVSFVAAGGILSHYVGDACQPLHISHMFDGIPQEDGSRKGKDVHSIYETTMINKNIGAILEAAQKQLKTAAYKRPLPIDSGKEAAGATVDLMKKTFRLVKPKKLVDIVIKYKEGQGLGATATAQKMWAEVGADSTGSIFANGAYYLAALWEGAWKVGKGNSAIGDTGKVDVDELVRTYENPGFLPSMNLKEIGGVIGL